MSFVEAVQTLAQQVGMVVPEEKNALPPAQRAEQQARGLALSDVMQQALHYYRQELRSTPQAIEYLKNRGLTGEIAGRYGLGYAPNAWDGLRKVFPDYESETLDDSGLVVKKDGDANSREKRYDRFRDRIMFPIRNNKGQTIGFGGRVLEKSEPKYLNSPETPLFHKGSELYGLFEARQAIRQSGYVIVTEGYMDVLALAQMGFPQTIATLGTACTPTHVQKLLRHTDRIVFCFDGDKAGRSAAKRALESSLALAADNKNIHFLFLPSEHDPDSYVREFGKSAFEKAIDAAMPLSQFLIQEVEKGKDLSTPEGQAKLVFDAKPLIKQLPATVLRSQILRTISERTGISLDILQTQLELGATPATRKTKRPPAKRTPPTGLPKQIIRALLACPSLIYELDSQTKALISSLPEFGDLLTYLMETALSMRDNTNFTLLSEQLRQSGTHFDSLISEIAASPDFEIEPTRKELNDGITRLRIREIEKNLRDLTETGLQSGLTLKDIQQKHIELSNEKKVLSDALQLSEM